MGRYSLIASAMVWLAVLLAPLLGQTNVVRSIRALDTNFNRYLEPHEITNRSRPSLKKIAPHGRIDILEPNSLRRWEEAVYRYYERRRTGDRRVAPDPPSPVLGFVPDDDAPLLPAFGLGEVKYPYSQRDLDEAEDTIRPADRNDDGFVDREEAKRSDWTRTNPFSSDYNKDNRLSRVELAQRYAARRLLEQGRERRYTTMRRSRDGLDRYTDANRNDSRSTSDRSARILSDSLLGRYDRNRNRILELGEIGSLGLNLREIDSDRNDELSREELDNWIRREVDSKNEDLTAALPEWFFDRDSNGDGQIQLSEYGSDWDDEKLGEFEQLDLNDDGFITSNEVLHASAETSGMFASEQAEILPPRSTVVSEIEVGEDLIAGDLDLQLSITHTYVAHLDGYVIGPDGHRTELFTGIGSDGDHFDNTVFDDDSRTNINKARAPFRGNYQPEAMANKQSGLNRYKKKNIQGLWQLMIRSSRSDRPGLLHAWSLIVKPAGEDSSEQESNEDEEEKSKEKKSKD